MKKKSVRMRRSAAIACCLLILMLAMGTIAFAQSEGGLFRILVNGQETEQDTILYEEGDQIVMEGDDLRTEMKSEGAEGEMEVDENGDVSVEIKKVK